VLVSEAIKDDTFERLSQPKAPDIVPSETGTDIQISNTTKPTVPESNQEKDLKSFAKYYSIQSRSHSSGK
jgi:hypothetical protein